jgi:tetratricopeptide (TPR) repeat protein
MLEQSALDALWDFDDPAGSELRMLQAARSRERTPEERAELETQRARALGLQGRFDEADAVLDRIDHDSPAVATRVLLERGRLRNSSGRPSEAIPLITGAAGIAARAGLVFLEVDALHMLAIVDADQAEHWTREGLAALERAGDDRTRRWAVALHNNLGWARHDANRLDEALEEFARARDAAGRFGGEEQRFFTRWAYARCLRSLGRIPEALVLQRELAAERPDDEDVAEELAILTAPPGD